MVTDNINKKTANKGTEKRREPKRQKAAAKDIKRGRETIDPPRNNPTTRTKGKGSVRSRAARIRKPTREDIARRAYDIWLSQGRPDGVETENWLRAEQELLRESVERVHSKTRDDIGERLDSVD